MTSETQDIKSKRFTIFSSDKYEVDLEYSEDFAILHLPYVYKFDKGTYMDMKSRFPSLLEFLGTMGYPNVWAAIPPSNTMTIKFIKKFGFEHKGSAEGYDVFMLEGVI